MLKRSICLEQNTQAWCDNCEKYQPTIQTRNICHLPDILVINCEVNSLKEADFWRMQAEVAFKMAMKKHSGEISKSKEFALADWKELGSPEGMLMCPSIEELKNVWLPFSIRMKMTKNKGLDVCNWTDGDEMQVVGKLGRGGGIKERKIGEKQGRGKVELCIGKRESG